MTTYDKKYDFDTIQNPTVREYMRRKMEGDTAVEGAQDTSKLVGYGNVAGNLLNNLGNSQKKDVILANRLQDLGSAPTVKAAERSKYDDFGSQALADSNVGQARKDAKTGLESYTTEIKLNDYAEGKARKDKEYAESDADNKDLRDPGSETSKIYQETASKIMPGRDFSKYSGAQIQKVMGPLVKSAQVEAMRARANRTPTAGNSEYKRRKQELELEKLEREAKDGPKLSTVQAKKMGLAIIGEKATEQYNKALDDGHKSGDYDPTSYFDFIDNSDTYAPNWMRSDSAIQAQAARDSWGDSYLRDESGAAIPIDERAKYYKIYFPQQGEDEKTVSNKAKLRRQKELNARMASGEQVESQPKFPVDVRKGGEVATVSSQEELKEARKEGWK